MIRKKVLGAAAVCALFVASPMAGAAAGQAPKEARNAISVNVLETLSRGTIDLSITLDYQRLLADHVALSVLLGLHHAWIGLNSFDASAEMDWHPFDKRLGGFYVGLGVLGACSQIVPEMVALAWGRTAGTTYFLGIVPAIGYQFLLPLHLDIDFSVGVALGGELSLDSAGRTMAGLRAHFSRIEVGVGLWF